MGQFQEMLNKINQVEAAGFDPMTESYSARIGKLETPTPDDPTPLTAEGITKSFTNLGYDDPIQELTDDLGVFNPTGLADAYNRTIDDPDIGVDPSAFIGFVNQNYPKELSTEYFEGAQLEVNPDQSLGFPSVDKPTTKPNLRFERAPSQSQKKGASDIFLQVNQDTGESETFDTQEAYDKARSNYKSITGVDVETGKKK